MSTKTKECVVRTEQIVKHLALADAKLCDAHRRCEVAHSDLSRNDRVDALDMIKLARQNLDEAERLIRETMPQVGNVKHGGFISPEEVAHRLFPGTVATLDDPAIWELSKPCKTDTAQLASQRLYLRECIREARSAQREKERGKQDEYEHAARNVAELIRRGSK